MARDTVDETPIESRDEIVAWMSTAGRPDKDWKIGTEHEKFGFHEADLSPVAYGGPKGVEKLLRGMEGLLGWEPILDAGRIIGLTDPTGGGAISIEPGGQFELSGAPLATLHETEREVNAHLAQVHEISEPLGIGFLGLGGSPKWTRSDTPIMPKSRYAIMTNYMPKVGSLGLDMMYRTATVQVNLDFRDEADMVEKMRISLALQPIATALFANSPFTDGVPNGFLSWRGEIWRDTDADRTGGLPFAFQPGFGFEAYVDWALDVPMYFVKRGDTYTNVAGIPFRKFLDDGLPDILPGERPTLGDWANHLGTLFPDVRLKRYLEMRGADAGSRDSLVALPALWVGLLYDAATQSAAAQLVADWTDAERLALRDTVPKLGLATPFRKGTVQDVARDVLALARQGLANRARLDAEGRDETRFLGVLDEMVADGRTQAEQLLELYNGAWKGSVDPVFTACRF